MTGLEEVARFVQTLAGQDREEQVRQVAARFGMSEADARMAFMDVDVTEARPEEVIPPDGERPDPIDDEDGDEE